ncbi:UDP-N-acetyl-D-mannosamine dehydrogenase [Listeria newyorkensis]|uniref:UDP-N-acetyl-D-mannosamine dehydrogenase n=1 Tax=Listeria newyorkensis TaxID=1497681 RepID=A0ABX4XKY5_9LIST|nr:nucleotide sugar dehydrogenase [Listeria newyorkensis]KGL45580.1 UDP-N-acetyl-D-mannosamine dehydrogenase [Listeria newyorkensis]PNP89378.1 UDP-N-acetyl-D-mannosamine dehydrogenase [Listeria newyorkensis]WAO22950.1 nucleotide sugar dehydrogenase [Listeria newyorkensis]SQC57231.1 UDP-glucose 6-dehydrogenase ywqF [Listeria newyorkensis]
MKVNVIGLGYIGLPTSIIFASHGMEVLGVDLNEDVVRQLNNGLIHIEENGLQTLFHDVVQSGHFEAATKPVAADAFIIAVPTPNREDEFKSCDNRYVISAVHAILPFLRKGNVVVVESTIAPRTMEDVVQPMIEAAGFVIGEDIYLSHCPERVLPGNIIHEMIYNPRIIGGMTEACTKETMKLYKKFVQGELIQAKAGEAELSKLMENTFRDVNIALANELAKISEKLDIDALKVIEMANLHPRVNLHSPGPGVGGHCLAVDPYFVVAAAPEVSPLIQTARAINVSMPKFVEAKVDQIMMDAPTNKVTVLGLTYKGNIDDIRESPAMEIMEALRLKYEVGIFDPHVASYSDSIEEATANSSLLLVLTDHKEFKELDLNFTQNMAQQVILDTKNVVKSYSPNTEYLNLGNLSKIKQAKDESYVY